MDFTLKIDKDGRMLLPKRLRKALHIGPGGELRVHLEGESMTLVREPQHASLREEVGLPLIKPPVSTRFEGDPIVEARAARDCEVLDEQ